MSQRDQTWLQDLKRADAWIVPTLLSVVLVVIHIHSYVTFHTVAEIFTVMISFTMFAFAWVSWRFVQNNFLIYLACGYFWVGVLDLLHALVFRGMDLIVFDDGNMSAQFWIGTRIFEALILLTAPIVLKRMDGRLTLFLGHGVVAMVLPTLILTDLFPMAFIAGSGLTPFKVVAEYVVIAVLLVAMVNIARMSDEYAKPKRGLIMAAIAATIISEVFFTVYEDVDALPNMLGHITKVYSFWLLFMAVVLYNLLKPYLAQLETELQYQEAVKIAKLGSYSFDIPTGTWQSSAMLDRIFGIGPGYETTTQGWLDIVHPEERDTMRDYLSVTVLSKHEAFDRTYRIVRANDSQTRWVHGAGELKIGSDGNVATMLGTIQDVTDETRDQMLREAQIEVADCAQRLSKTETLQTVLKWCEKITDSQISFFHFVNDDQESIELITWSERTLAEFCHVEDLNTHYPISDAGIWAEAFWQRKPVIYNDYDHAEGRKGLPDGHAHLTRLISMPLIEDDKVRVLLGVGNKIGDYEQDDVNTLSILVDQAWHIVGQRRAESASARLFQAVDQGPATVIMTDTDGIIEYINPAFTKVTGYGWPDVQGRTPRILKSGNQSDEDYENLWHTITRGETWSGRMRNRKKDGGYYWASVMISPLKDRSGAVTGYLGIGEDITDRYETELQLLQAQKVGAIGQMASGIAHDINNMLVPIIGLGELIQKDLKDDPKQARRFEKILEAANRARDLLKNIVMFGRSDIEEDQAIDISAITFTALDVIRQAIPSSLEFDVHVEPDVGKVKIDPGAYTALLMNFATNARDAMKKGNGTLAVSLTRIKADETLAKQITNLTPGGGYALLSVRDDGKGISENEQQRIFDPFFTTKEVGKGGGLGLSMSHQTVIKAGGAIRVRSELGKWTEFNVYLPLSADDEVSLD